MRILLASSSSGSQGGGEIYLLYLGKELAALGHAPVLWASDAQAMDPLCQEFSCFGQVERTRYTNTYQHKFRSLATFWNDRKARQISAHWQSLNPDVIHLNKQNLEDGLDLVAAANYSAIPAVCTIHLTQSASYLKARAGWLRDWTARYYLNKFSGTFISVQQQRADDLSNFLEQQRPVQTVYNGVPIPAAPELARMRCEHRRNLQLHDNNRLFLGVGRVMSQKRPELFLDLACRIRSQLPTAQFLWLGSGQLDSHWDDWVNARDLHDCVRRIDWTRDVLSYLAAADYFLHTASYEGMPLALFEAMAAGVPCIITPNLHEDMPFLNATTNLVADGDKWLDQLNDKKLLNTIATKARALVCSKYSVAEMAKSTLGVYQQETLKFPKKTV